MTKLYQNKNNKQTYKATVMASGILLENVVSDERKTIAKSTLNRYYVEVQEQPKVKTVPTKTVQAKAAQTKAAQTTKQPAQTATKTAQPTKQAVQAKKYPYYKHYERNEKPLWNTEESGDFLFCCNEKGVKIIKCSLSKTGNCIKIEQIASKAKRYFTNFARAKRHIIYDQDINTTKYIGSKFDLWLKKQQKRLTKGDK